MLFGSSTFLRLYVQNKRVEPIMLDSLRVVVAGAEKLREDVRDGFKDKFNQDILEGYGATEMSPVVSVNIPDHPGPNNKRLQLGSRSGSVGMPLPGTSIKVIDPETKQERPPGASGMILTTGPQLMAGYLANPTASGTAVICLDGARWYVTGDKGYLDEDGFLWIVDRYSRFAKIGGEMVSLGAVENVVLRAIQSITTQQIDDQTTDVIATSIPDARKGEAIVLLTSDHINDDVLKSAMMKNGATGIMLPDRIVVIDEMPKLGSGKPNYAQAKSIALSN